MGTWQAAGFWCGIVLTVGLIVWSIYQLGRDAGKRQVKIRTLGPANIELGTRIRLVEAGADDPTAFRLKCMAWNDLGGFELTLEDERRRRPNGW